MDSQPAARRDRAGMLVAFLCFIHCAAGPALLTFAGFASVITVWEKFDVIFLLTSAIMGGVTLVPGYRKRHGRISCLAMFATGMFCLLIRRHVAWRDIAAEPLFVAMGASLLVGAHFLNLRFQKRCECCNDPSPLTAESGPLDSESLPPTRLH